jgi:hypothetical protein
LILLAGDDPAEEVSNLPMAYPQERA